MTSTTGKLVSRISSLVSRKSCKQRNREAEKLKGYEKKCGHTLIELIIVLAVVSVIIAISVSSIGNFLSRSRLKNSAEDITSTLRWARRLAITKREVYRVVFNPKKRKYWVENEEGNVLEKKQSLEENIIFANPELYKEGEEDGIVEFNDPDDNSFSFYPQGTAEAGSIYLQGKGNREWYTITIASTTGYVKVYSEKH